MHFNACLAATVKIRAFFFLRMSMSTLWYPCRSALAHIIGDKVSTSHPFRYLLHLIRRAGKASKGNATRREKFPRPHSSRTH